MKRGKRYISLALIVMLILLPNIGIPCSALAKEQSRVFDRLGYLTDEEESQLNQIIHALQQKHNMDAVIVFTDKPVMPDTVLEFYDYELNASYPQCVALFVFREYIEGVGVVGDWEIATYERNEWGTYNGGFVDPRTFSTEPDNGLISFLGANRFYDAAVYFLKVTDMYPPKPTEKYISLWGIETKWELKNQLHMFLCIWCFGWIWMVFFNP